MQPKLKLKPLIKSASLILLIPNISNGSYKTLLLQRKSSMSFSSAYVFPGGVCDNEDIQTYGSHEFVQYGRMTALRQFYEETGLLIYPTSSSHLIQKDKILQNTPLQTSKLILELWSHRFDLLKPLVRLLTPQTYNSKRFDCIFYVCFFNESISIFNPKQAKKSKTKSEIEAIFNISNINFNKSESDDLLINDISQILTAFSNQKIILFPPQVIILTALTNAKKLQQILTDPQMKIEPIIFDFDLQNKTLKIIGDKQYNVAQMLSKQPQSISRTELQQFFNSRFNLKQNSFRRISMSKFGATVLSSYNEKGFISLLPINAMTKL